MLQLNLLICGAKRCVLFSKLCGTHNDRQLWNDCLDAEMIFAQGSLNVEGTCQGFFFFFCYFHAPEQVQVFHIPGTEQSDTKQHGTAGHRPLKSNCAGNDWERFEAIKEKRRRQHTHVTGSSAGSFPAHK